MITCLRIVCALVLFFCPTFSGAFYLFYIFAGISDVLDGFAARHWGQETALGAKLDTIADIVFTAVVLVKLLLSVHIPLWLICWALVIAGIKCFNIVCGFILYKHFVAEHTLANKICGVLLFLLPLCIGHFPWQGSAILCILICALSTFAAVQEGHYIRTGKEII